MTPVDYILAAAILLSTVFGAIRGFLRESVALLGWLVGLWLAWRYAGRIEPYLGGAMRDTLLQVWAARLLVLIAVVIAAWLLGSLLSYLVQRSICNVVKCRPPQNRNPSVDEVAVCSPFLFRQIEAIQPRVLCLLGNYATQTLLQTTLNISQLRGKDRYWRGTPVVATFHPAYLLRNPAQKASVWSDLKRVLELLKEDNEGPPL